MLTSDLYPAAWLLATLAACDVRQTQVSGRLFLACSCITSSLHVHMSQSQHHVLMLLAVNAIVTQPLNHVYAMTP